MSQSAGENGGGGDGSNPSRCANDDTSAVAGLAASCNCAARWACRAAVDTARDAMSDFDLTS